MRMLPVSDRAPERVAAPQERLWTGTATLLQTPVEASVVAVTPAEQGEIEQSYDGLLRLESFLEPLE